MLRLAFYNSRSILAAVDVAVLVAIGADVGLFLAKAACLSCFIEPKASQLGQVRLLGSTSAWVCSWTAFGIAILQLAAANASGAIAEETCLVNIAELIVLPSFQRHQAAKATLGGIRNLGPPSWHGMRRLFGISMALECLASPSHLATQSAQGNDQLRPLHWSRPSRPKPPVPSTFGKTWRHTGTNGWTNWKLKQLKQKRRNTSLPASMMDHRLIFHPQAVFKPSSSKAYSQLVWGVNNTDSTRPSKQGIFQKCHNQPQKKGGKIACPGDWST